MQKTKHTPGPWRSAHKLREVYTSAFGGASKAIAYLNQDYMPETIEANARLIAASPAMYSYIEQKAVEGDDQAKAIIDQI